MKTGKVRRLQSPLLHEQQDARCSTKNCSRTWAAVINNTLLCAFCASHKTQPKEDTKEAAPRQ